jgi:hypothetical protein
MNCIFLSKNNSDEYINMLAGGPSNTVSDIEFENIKDPIVIRSIAKRKLIKKLIDANKDFFYVDSGYWGNYKSPLNPNGWKWYHRIVKNALQHNHIIDRPSDRWEKLNYKIPNWKKTGNKILLVAPSEKPCKFYNIDLESWINSTVDEIKKYTDREVVVRTKVPRPDRVKHNTIFDAMDDDCHAIVTYNSIAATEAVLHGIPAFYQTPNAAAPVASNDLTTIDSPIYADKDLIYKWACHLAYGQFHIQEMSNGTAIRMLKNN